VPVLVVPADTPIGVPLVRALRAEGAEVRAYATGSGDVGALRAAGAYVAVGDLDDEGRLDAAMTDAHTTIALHADPLVPSAEQLDTALRAALTAAANADIARLIVRSVPMAAAGADPLRRVCAGIEAALVELPMTTLAVRTSLIDTPALRDALASTARVDRALPVAPLHVDDVVAGLVALDAARSASASGHGTFRLQGRPTTLGEHLDHVAGGMLGRVYTPADRVPLLAAALRTSWFEADTDHAADLLAFAGVAPHGLAP
jgi:uncharacterized protein YbjT (DUF2867 family)